MDGSSLATLSPSNIQLYTVETTDTTNYPITEASVAHALSRAEGTSTEVKYTAVTISADANLSKTAPAEDGSTVTLDENDYKALKWTAADNTVYAVVYTNSTSKKTTCKIVRINGAKTTTTTQQGS